MLVDTRGTNVVMVDRAGRRDPRQPGMKSFASSRVCRGIAFTTILGLAACSASAGESPRTPSTASPTSQTTATVPLPLPLPPPWKASPAEPAPDIKKAAARMIQVLGTYAKGGGSLAATRRRLRSNDQEPAIANAATALLDADARGTVDIIYPELAGLAATEASVLVVARFTTKTSSVRTIDVRLARGAAGWRSTAIASVGGEQPTEVRASPAGQALLENPRVDLPDTARWDLEAARVDDRIANLLRRIAVDYYLRVTVFGTGHPLNVFGTDRLSNHAAGRAVDIWSIDGVPVADQRTSDTVASIIQLALDAGATEIGAPVDPDGRGGIVFTNTVHLDHLHLAFKQ